MPSKQPSRKGKKAWRKNVDVTDVETGLEKVREEIVYGGVIKEKEDAELFALDLGGDESIPKRQKVTKALRADEILAARSAIPTVPSRKRANPNVTDGIITKKKLRKDGVSYKELQKLRQIAWGNSEVPVALKKPADTPDYDPWDDTPKPVPETDKKYDFLEKKQSVKAPPTLKHAPVSLAVAVSEIPAVRLPEAGISYNPEFAKWDGLLQKEGEKAVADEKKRLAEEAEERRIMELRNMPDPEEMEEEESDESDESGEDDEEGLQIVEHKERMEVKRKTQAQRNKEKRQKEQEMATAEKKNEKLMARELLLIKKFSKDARAKERIAMANRLAKISALKDDEKNPKLMRKKRFGKIHLPRAPLELQLPDELAESLRRLKPEGNLLGDRYRSLRERGVLEHRAPIVQAKKAKKKATEKWSYKDFQ